MYISDQNRHPLSSVFTFYASPINTSQNWSDYHISNVTLDVTPSYIPPYNLLGENILECDWTAIGVALQRLKKLTTITVNFFSHTWAAKFCEEQRRREMLRGLYTGKFKLRIRYYERYQHLSYADPWRRIKDLDAFLDPQSECPYISTK